VVDWIEGSERKEAHRGNSSMVAQSGRWGTGGDGSNEWSMRPTVELERIGEPAWSSWRLKGAESWPEVSYRRGGRRQMVAWCLLT
jgi:hypothetical protein